MRLRTILPAWQSICKREKPRAGKRSVIIRTVKVWLIFGVAVVLTLQLGVPVSAEVVVSFPLEGRYRAGRYIPVRIVRTSETAAVKIDAPKTVPTELAAGPDADVVVPWLAVTESAGPPSWQLAGGDKHELPIQLRALGENERLVGFAGANVESGPSPFPGKTIVPIPLDLSRPLLEPVSAWESLDAVVLSPSAVARLDSAHRAALLAAGTTVVVRSSSPPDQEWPWKRSGDEWVLSLPRPLGPEEVLEPQAYVPTYGWERGWPRAFRRQILLAGIAFAILATGLSLWRTRWTIVGVVALAGVAVAGFAFWYARQSPVLQLAVGIQIPRPGATQFDLWSWQSPVRPADASFPFAGLSKPVVATLRQIDGEELKLLCDEQGRPRRF